MSSTVARPVALIIMDGWGYREDGRANAIALANTPNWNELWKHSSRTLLSASGRAVGLPEGQMGNSEVGHLNLGAGRVVMQDLVRITAAIEDGSFFANPTLLEACRVAKENGSTLHLLGLLGNGGVHAMDKHLFALLDLVQRQGVKKVALHALLDGRDTAPKSGLGFLKETLERCEGHAQLASLSGRYYGMDRDNRWERVALWYKAAVQGDAPHVTDALAAVQRSYDEGVSDEFVKPMVIADADGNAVAPMKSGDVLVCFNYRSDRMREALRALTVPDFNGFETGERPKLHIVTMTHYDDAFSFPTAFAAQTMLNLVGEVVSNAGLTQLRTAETEKYPHVTFFFNGGRDEPFPGEDRVMVPSPKVATYDMQPEMSASGVCDALCDALAHRKYDFMLCNFANTDMVGHTGSIPATIKAAETVDACLGRILAAAKIGNVQLIVTADHGNAELMVDAVTGQPYTAHTTNPVPLVIVGGESDHALRSSGALCDVGPTVLRMLGLQIPPEMSGRDLRTASLLS
ncbi:MAG: 2,3-bisphosphoglycerate-independent phosphoglycerate mutase [Gemmatimonadaceae bacterium]